jgi:precorrin-2 methylase
VIGDPEQWTVFPDLADVVATGRPSLAIHVEPGVASYQAAAATSRARLGRPGHPLTVVDHVDDLDRHLAGDGAVVLYKASTDAAAVRATAARHRRDDGLVAELAGLPGGRVVPLGEAGDGPIAYLATVLFPSRAPAPAGGRR